VTTLPTYDQVLELPETIRQQVPADFIDENGHMNIGRYFELSAQAVWLRYTEVGMGQAYIDERGLTTFTAEHHLRYLAELRLGEELSVHVRAVDRSAKVLHTMAFVVDRSNRRLACTFEDTLVHVDLATRRPRDLPEDIATRLDAMLAEHRGLAWAPPVCGVMGVRRG
jgi:acyl-CoA thioester hydrolase